MPAPVTHVSNFTAAGTCLICGENTPTVEVTTSCGCLHAAPLCANDLFAFLAAQQRTSQQESTGTKKKPTASANGKSRSSSAIPRPSSGGVAGPAAGADTFGESNAEGSTPSGVVGESAERTPSGS